MSASVATRNPFAILDEESSPDAAPQKTASKTAPPPVKDAPKKTGPAARGGRYYQRGGAKVAGGREGNANEDVSEANQKKFNSEGRGRGRGRGRGDRGGRGGRGGGDRAYDRHSMTGKIDSEKKMHQSWGGDDGNAELKAETAATNDAAAEATWGAGGDNADAWGAPPASGEDTGATNTGAAAGDAEKGAGAGESRRREREPEEDENTLTLEQYLAQKKESDVIPKLSGTRKPNDGADDSAWKDAVPLKKADEEEEAYFAGKGKSAPKARTEKKEKVFLEIEARFDRPARGGGRGRGGERGGDRGAPTRGPTRGRGGPNRGRSSAAVDVGDEKAFPSLS